MPGPPRYGTPLVGRDLLARKLAADLDRAGGVWTLAGPGGVGKTRLAALVATNWGGAGWWVDLQAVRDAPGLIRALSHGMGLEPQADAVQVLADRGRALLVLDNFEQLVETCSNTVDEWLSAAPSLRMLVTSREGLRAAAERVVEVQPLPGEEAAEVFLSAAPFVFEAEAADPEVLGRILDVLEGLPLALELAAARLDVMTLEQLRDRLADPLAVLQDPSRFRTRHGGLEAAVAWSWDLLSAEEQATLGQCAVFRGGFDLEAAEAVLRVDGSVLDLIHRLRQRRLLTFDGGRFGMLEVIRQYASNAWDQGDIGLRHSAYYAGLARSWSDEMGTAQLGSALDGMSLEYDNLRAALEGESVPSALIAGRALGSVLEHRGPVMAQIPVINRVLERCPDDALARSDLLRQRAFYLEKRGRTEEAHADLQLALELVEATPVPAARVRLRLADLHIYMGEEAQARQEYERALADASGERDLEASAVIQLAVLAHDRGENEEARRLEQRALELAEDGQNPFRVAKVLGLMGTMATERQELTVSRGYHTRALAIYKSLDIPRSVAFTTGQLGLIAEVCGEYSTAISHYEKAVEGSRTAQDRRLLGCWLGFLGRVHILEGRLDLGRQQATEAIEILTQAKSLRMISVFHAVLAGEAAARSDLEAATHHADAIDLDTDHDKALADVAVHVARCRVAAQAGDDAAAARHLAEAIAIRDAHQCELGGLRRGEMNRIIDFGRTDTEAWAIAADGSWFRPPGGDKVEVRGAQAGVLAKLLRLHGVDDAQVEDLVEAGWPHERISEAAATNRVYVALTSLRKLGIRPILVNARPGWRLDPSVTVRKG